MAESNVQPLVIPEPSVSGEQAYHFELIRLFEQYYRELFWVNTEATGDITASSTNTTPIRQEHIICNSSSALTVTLNDGTNGDGGVQNFPFEDQIVIVTNYGAGQVTVDAGANQINGQNSYTQIQYVSLCYKWSDIVDSWIIF